jgi:hypothetical protein
MASLVYILCAVTSALCTWLLMRAYRANRSPLLFWSGLCFAGLAVSNLLLVADRMIFPDVDLAFWRLATSLAGMTLLLYGLIWHGE